MGSNRLTNKRPDPHPRISSARVQKPNRSADGPTHEPTGPSVGGSQPAGPVPLDVMPSAAQPRTLDDDPEIIYLRPFGIYLDWLTVNMRAPEGATMRLLPWQQIEPVTWTWEPHMVERAAREGLTEDDLAPIYTVEPTDLRTAQFERVSYVLDENREKVATVWHTPHDNRLHTPNWIQVQFSNPTLYDGRWATLFRMFRVLGCELSGISRVDIACDGVSGEGGNWPQVVDRAWKGEARYYGHCDWLARSSRGKAIGGEFGTRKSNKFIRAYNKTREMKRKGTKRHIVDRWAMDLGYDPTAGELVKDVNRFEVQLKGKEVRRYFPEEKGAQGVSFLLSLSDRQRLVDVFASMAVEMFDFRTYAKRARDAQYISRWDWSAVATNGPRIAHRAQRNYAITDYTIKANLRAMWQTGTVMGVRQVLQTAEHVAKAGGPHIQKWYAMKKEQWRKYYAKLDLAGDQRTVNYFHSLARDPDEPLEQMPDDWSTTLQSEEIRRLASGEFNDFPFGPDSSPGRA